MPKNSTINAEVITSIQKESRQPEDKSSHDDYAPHLTNLSVLKSIQNSYHTKALHFKATCNVGLGFKTLDENSDPLSDMPGILETANPMDSFQDIIMQAALDFEETGTGYLEVVRDRKGDPAELYWIPSETMHQKKDRTRFIQRANRKETLFAPYGMERGEDMGEIISFKYPTNKSPYYGSADWLGCVGSILLDQYAVEWNHNFFMNNAVPSYAVVIEGGEMSKAVEERIRDFLQQNLKGVANAHKMLLLPIRNKNVKVKFEEIMKRPTDGAFEKLRNQIRDEIISAHGVPPRLLGVISSGSLGGGGEAEQQLRIFKEISINPKQRLFESVINRTLGRDLGFQIKFDGIDVTPEKDDVVDLTALVSAGIVQPNEARDELGYSALKNEKEAGDLLEKVVALREILKQADIQAAA